MPEIQKALYDNQGNKINQETSAAAVSIADSGNYFDGGNAEAVLQEVGFDIVDRYTKQEAVRKFALLEEKTGNSVQIADTIDAPFAELEILGGTKAVKANPDLDVSPDNPQTFEFLQHSFDYMASAKNIFDGNMEIGGISITTGANVTGADRVRTTDYISVIPNIDLVVTQDGALKVTSVYYYTISKQFISYSSGVSTFKTPSNCYFVRFVYVTGYTNTAKLMVSPGKTASTYEAYQGITIATITLKDTSDNQLEAREIPDVAVDVVFKDSDVKWKLREITQTNANLVDTFLSAYTSTNCACFRGQLNYPNPTWAANAIGICNNFKLNNGVVISTTTSDEAFVVGGGAPNYQQFYIKILKSRLTGWDDSLTDAQKVALMNTWLTANVTMIICKRTTPVGTELDSVSQTALNLAESTGTFSPIANISLSTPIGQVHVKAAKNITKVISDLTAAVALLG